MKHDEKHPKSNKSHEQPAQGRAQGGIGGPLHPIDLPGMAGPARTRWLIAGIAVGALGAFLLDPDRGRRRRRLLRDKVERYLRESYEFIESKSVDLANRLKGFLYEIDKVLGTEPRPSDDLLMKRIRAQLGRYVTHSRSIHVDVTDGHVTLTGPILSREVEDLISMVRRMHGVRQVINHLEEHASSDGIPGLQGAGKDYLKH